MRDSWITTIKLDKSDKKAVYMQIADEIIKSIKNGIIKSGETLPSTRQIAEILGVNRNTVIRTFDILLSEGWLISEDEKEFMSPIN